MPRRDGDWVKTTLATMKPLAERFPDGWTSIGDTAADRVGMCPAQAAGNNWPGWSSVLAARQVGLAAVRTGVLDARDAVRAAVQSLLQDSDADREFQRVQDWIAGLPRIARLDVADEALRWLVAWRSIGPHVSGPSVVDRGSVQARITKEVTLRASADLLVRPAGAVDSTVYVSLGTVAAPDADRNVAARVRRGSAVPHRTEGHGKPGARCRAGATAHRAAVPVVRPPGRLRRGSGVPCVAPACLGGSAGRESVAVCGLSVVKHT